MKYVKDDREIADKSEFENIPEEYVEGLRLAEQPRNVNNGNDVVFADTLEEHIKNFVNLFIFKIHTNVIFIKH